MPDPIVPAPTTTTFISTDSDSRVYQLIELFATLCACMNGSSDEKGDTPSRKSANCSTESTTTPSAMRDRGSKRVRIKGKARIRSLPKISHVVLCRIRDCTDYFLLYAEL